MLRKSSELPPFEPSRVNAAHAFKWDRTSGVSRSLLIAETIDLMRSSVGALVFLFNRHKTLHQNFGFLENLTKKYPFLISPKNS